MGISRAMYFQIASDWFGGYMAAVSGNQVANVGKETFRAARERDLTGMAQQIAYNVLFALGPLLIFITALAGFLTQRINSDAENPVLPITNWMNDNLPDSAASFLQEPVENALKTSPGFMLSFGALLALWGARNAVAILMKGLNLALGVEETRSWFKQQLTAIGLTVAGAVMLAVTSILFVLGTSIGNDLADAIGLGNAWATVSVWLRWPVIAVVIVAAVALLNRFAPDHAAPLRWYLPGATLTVVLWAISLVGLRIYFAVSGSYAEAYGVFGAVLAFVFWLYVMSLVTLIGGVINSAVQQEIPAAEGDELPTPAA
jgi:membrane protein